MIRILLLGLVLAGVYYLYRMVTQQNASTLPVPPAVANDSASSEAQAQDEQAAEAQPAPDAGESIAAAERAAQAEAQDMQECPLCLAYVPATAHDGCGRPDCPIPMLAAENER